MPGRNSNAKTGSESENNIEVKDLTDIAQLLGEFKKENAEILKNVTDRLTTLEENQVQLG